MFTIEDFRGFSAKLAHLESIDDETFLLNSVDNFSDVLIRAGLDHCEGVLTA